MKKSEITRRRELYLSEGALCLQCIQERKNEREGDRKILKGWIDREREGAIDELKKESEK